MNLSFGSRITVPILSTKTVPKVSPVKSLLFSIKCNDHINLTVVDLGVKFC